MRINKIKSVFDPGQIYGTDHVIVVEPSCYRGCPAVSVSFFGVLQPGTEIVESSIDPFLTQRTLTQFLPAVDILLEVLS